MDQTLVILNLIKGKLDEVRDVNITHDSGGIGIPFEGYVYKDDVVDVQTLLDDILIILTEPEKYESMTTALNLEYDALLEKLNQKRFFKGGLRRDMDSLLNTISSRKSLAALVNPEYFTNRTK